MVAPLRWSRVVEPMRVAGISRCDAWHCRLDLPGVGAERCVAGATLDGNAVMAVPHEVQVADGVALNGGTSCPAGEQGDPLHGRCDRRERGRKHRSNSLTRRLSSADDRVQLDDLQAEVVFGDPAQGRDDIVKGQHRQCVVALQRQARDSFAREKRRCARAKLVIASGSGNPVSMTVTLPAALVGVHAEWPEKGWGARRVR